MLDVCAQAAKLDSKSLFYVFLGYSLLQKVFRCFSPTFNHCLVSTDFTFFESTPFDLLSFIYESWG